MPSVHVVGAGLAGLACAVRLAQTGHSVTLYEAAGQAGGRCRSLHDPTLGRTIDNGNHLLMSGNSSAMAYLETIGAAGSLTGPEHPVFPFLDLESGERWAVRPNAGPLPWWILSPARRVPGTRARDYLGLLGLLFAPPLRTVAECFPLQGMLYRRFCEPLAVAALNTPPERAAAHLLRPVLLETFARGASACRPLVARDGLSHSFVDPALAFLRSRGARICFEHRLKSLAATDGRLQALCFDRLTLRPSPDDAVVLAVPPAAARGLLPDLPVPAESCPIVNVHYRLPEAPQTGEAVSIIGLIGGVAQWLFLRGDIASVTVSAAGELVNSPAQEIGTRIWQDVAAALELSAGDPPPFRVIKERRATFAQTPEAIRRRPDPATGLENLFLAGDWTNTGLPATIEGAVRSGQTAAATVLAWLERTARVGERGTVPAITLAKHNRGTPMVSPS